LRRSIAVVVVVCFLCIKGAHHDIAFGGPRDRYPYIPLLSRFIPLSFVFLRAEREMKGLLTPPSYVRAWKRNMETLMGVFGAITKGSWHAWNGFFVLFYCFVDVLVLQDKHA
jgi:hypothetical protein